MENECRSYLWSPRLERGILLQMWGIGIVEKLTVYRLSSSAQPSRGQDQVWLFVIWEFLEPIANGDLRKNS